MSLLIHPALPSRSRAFSMRRDLSAAGVNLLLSSLGALAILALVMAGIVAAWPQRQRK